MPPSTMFYLIAGAVAAYVAYQTFFGDNGDADQGHPKPPSYEPQVRRRDERLPPTRPSYEPAQPPVHQRDERQRPPTIDSSLKDESVSPRDKFASLRTAAKQEGDLMSKCYDKSKAAYGRREGALAKTLSEEGNRHRDMMRDLDAKASAIIFKENNKDKEADEIDLHNLYVKEAIAYAEEALDRAHQKGFLEIRFIVGQGNHSNGGVARIKPAIQEAMRAHGYSAAADPHNPGVLVVPLPVGGR